MSGVVGSLRLLCAWAAWSAIAAPAPRRIPSNATSNATSASQSTYGAHATNITKDAVGADPTNAANAGAAIGAIPNTPLRETPHAQAAVVNTSRHPASATPPASAYGGNSSSNRSAATTSATTIADTRSREDESASLVSGSATSNRSASCGVSRFAPGLHSCPQTCPFTEPDAERGCHFLCVRKDDCGNRNERTHVPDLKDEACRRCRVVGCHTCSPHENRCISCNAGYDLVGSVCLSRMRRVWDLIFLLAGLLALMFLAWYVHLLLRPAVNSGNVQDALMHRSYSRLRSQGDGHSWHPLTTDLRSFPEGEPAIGGPGLLLHFNFQFAMIIWCMLVICGWLLLSVFVGDDLFIVGTLQADNPMEMCQAVRKGNAFNEGNLLGKLIFTGILYVVTAFGLLAFNVRQGRLLDEVDSQSATMMDYAALCKGFPCETGSSLEQEYLDFLTHTTGCKLVGISVCWDFRLRREDVYDAVADEIRLLEGVEVASVEAASQTPPQKLCCAWRFFDALDAVLGVGSFPRAWPACTRTCAPLLWALRTMWGTVPWVRARIRARGDVRSAFIIPPTVVAHGGPAASPAVAAPGQAIEMKVKGEATDSQLRERDDVDAQSRESRLVGLLAGIQSTGEAFAVFASESERDFAVAALAEEDGPRFRGRHSIIAQAVSCEPGSVVWHNFGTTLRLQLCSLIVGIAVILAAIVFWAVCFYAPYAYYESSYISSTGEPPGFASDMAFSMLVVVGNQIVYALCTVVAEGVKSPYSGLREATYVTLYTAAVLVNIFVDVLIVVYTSYLSMVAADVRTDDGKRLTELANAEAVFLSYPMQKAVGKTLYEYNVPSTFLVPFLLEPVFAILLPYHIGVRLVRSRLVNRQDAEDCLAPAPMDLARYGDLLVNVLLAILSLFFASGYVLKNFLGLLAGHLFIYAYDHYRVLRQVQDFYFSSGAMEAVAQRIAAVPCAVLAACVTLQMRGLNVLGLGRLRATTCCVTAFFVHLVVHMLTLAYLVPCLGSDVHRQAEAPYREAAARFPANWFTVNPVHCLRSKYVHRHQPPCVFFMKGKDHFLKLNEQLGLHYQALTWTDDSLNFPLLNMSPA